MSPDGISASMGRRAMKRGYQRVAGRAMKREHQRVAGRAMKRGYQRVAGRAAAIALDLPGMRPMSGGKHAAHSCDVIVALKILARRTINRWGALVASRRAVAPATFRGGER